MIEALIDSSVILESLQNADKGDALNEVVDAMIEAGCIQKADRKHVVKQIADREALGSTGIGNGVAVPHVKNKRVKEISLALARSHEGIEYDAIDGQPVHTVFMILAPEDQADQHLQALRWISGLARNADFRRFVMTADGVDGIRDLLREMSASA